MLQAILVGNTDARLCYLCTQKSVYVGVMIPEYSVLTVLGQTVLLMAMALPMLLNCSVCKKPMRPLSLGLTVLSFIQ